MPEVRYTCGVCSIRRERADCHVVELTDEEVRSLTNAGLKPEKELFYCKPCWKTLTDPKTAPMVMKGLFQMRLRQLGVSNSEEIANRYYAGLLQKIRPRPS